MGVITEVQVVGDSHVFRVDDGTGAVVCRCKNLDKFNIQQAKEIEVCHAMVASQNESEVSIAMKGILDKIAEANKERWTSLERGDTIHIVGFVRNIHNVKQIIPYRLHNKCPWEHEVDRVFEVSGLYSQVYYPKEKKDSKKDNK